MLVGPWINPVAPLAALAFGIEDGWKSMRDEPGALWPGRPLLTKLYYRGLVFGTGARQVRDGLGIAASALRLKGGRRGR